MRWIRRVIGGGNARVRSQRAERELDEELRVYLETAVAEKMRGGMNRDEATRAARLETGLVSMDSVKERGAIPAGRSGSTPSVRTCVLPPVSLAKDRSFTIAAVVALGLAIGLNASVFAIINTAFLRDMGPLAVASATLREEVRAMDPSLPLFAIETLDQAQARGRVSARLFSTWFASLAVVALVLAAVGVFAITAHNVTQRTEEIGVRKALGANGWDVVRMCVRRTLKQLALAIALGLGGSLALGNLIGSLLQGVERRDIVPLTVVTRHPRIHHTACDTASCAPGVARRPGHGHEV